VFLTARRLVIAIFQPTDPAHQRRRGWNARVMPIAAYRKWLNFQVQSEVMTAGVEYVEGVERVATD
jgi:hypothetical protein